MFVLYKKTISNGKCECLKRFKNYEEAVAMMKEERAKEKRIGFYFFID